MDYPASEESGVPCHGVMNLEGTVLERGCDYDRVNGPCGHYPDGTRVAFTAMPEGAISFPVTEEELAKVELYVADTDGSNAQRLTFNDYCDGHCSW